MGENEVFQEFLDYQTVIDDINNITFDVDDKAIVDSKTSIRILFKAKKGYPEKTTCRFIIPYGWEPIDTKNGFCTIKSSVKGKIKATESQLMLEYILEEPIKVGDTIEFDYNRSRKVNAAGDVAYVDKVYCALDIKLLQDKLYTRIGVKEITMVSDDASFFLVKIPTIYQGNPVDIDIVALDKFGNRDNKFEGEIEIDGDDCLEFPKNAKIENGYVKIQKALKFKGTRNPGSNISKLLRMNTGFTLFPVVPELMFNMGKLQVKCGEISGSSNPIVWDEDVSTQVYWGDTHIHTREFSDGIGTGNDAFYYAKNVVLHDFAALGDHLNQRFNIFMEGRKTIFYPYSEEIWNSLINLCKKWTDESFAAIPAYEWSGRNLYVKVATKSDSPHEAISDKVILFPLESAATAPLIDYASKEGCFQYQLYEALRGVDCAIITHTPISLTMGTSWTEVDNAIERIVEIYSQHGSSESIRSGYRPLANNKKRGSVIWALNNGFKLGFIGGGDDHYSHPGCPINQYKMKNLVPILRYRPGIAAIFSDQLNSRSLIKNLNMKNCYATTGERMWIKTKISSALMGQEVEVFEPPIIIVEVCGTKKVESVELIKKGTVIAIRVPTLDRIKFAYQDNDLKNDDEAYYYARATQFDGERGWSSPIWVKSKYI